MLEIRPITDTTHYVQISLQILHLGLFVFSLLFCNEILELTDSSMNNERSKDEEFDNEIFELQQSYLMIINLNCEEPAVLADNLLIQFF